MNARITLKLGLFAAMLALLGGCPSDKKSEDTQPRAMPAPAPSAKAWHRPTADIEFPPNAVLTEWTNKERLRDITWRRGLDLSDPRCESAMKALDDPPHDTQGMLDRLADVSRVLADTGITSEVEFKTRKADAETTGAFVHYQLLARPNSDQAGEPTSCMTKLPIGYYLIWTERGSHPTSKKTFREVLQLKERFVIEETE